MEQLKIEKNIEGPLKFERFIIIVICLAAAIRVFIFCAAFPFFNNVDEQSHFDLVLKYSKGHFPKRALEKFDPESAEIIAENGSPEFLNDANSAATAQEKKWIAEQFSNINNRETWSWPSYYFLAGIWCRAGKAIGWTSGHLLYWIRFLNVPIMAALVWVSYLIGRRFFSDNPQCRIAVPVLTAFFPQDFFYGITSDALSPLVFAISFYMLLEIYLGEKSWRYHLLAGLFATVTLLTKASNNAIVLLSFVVILFKIKKVVSEKRFKNYAPSLAAFCLASMIPIVLWLLHNYYVLGDLIGAAATMKERGWTKKSFDQFFNHPILTWKGLAFFLGELTRTYWRGEFTWKMNRMAVPAMDIFYLLSSGIFLAAAIWAFLFKSKANKPVSFVFFGGFFVIAASILFLAYSSMRLDFGECVYPSRSEPYFTSGRLMAGTIVPFIILYIYGLRYILSKLKLASFTLLIIIVIGAGITISEIAITLPAFYSAFNWYHLK